MSTPAISLAHYHAALAISPSKLKFWAQNQRTPGRYADKYVTRTVKSESKSTAFIIGQMVEDFVQRGLIGPEYVRSKFDSYRTAEAKAWKAAQEGAGKTLYDECDYEQVTSIVAVVNEHDLTPAIKAHGEQQRTFRATLSGGVILQCRPDWFLPQGLDGMSDPLAVDLKTCEDINDFDADIFKWGYHWAAYLTRFLAGRELKYSEIGYAWLVVDKQEKPECQYIRCTETHFALAQTELEDSGLLMSLIDRYRSGDWSSNNVRDAILPRWAERKAASAP